MILSGEITENKFLTGNEECSFDFETRRDENVDILGYIRSLSEEIERRLSKGVLTSDDDDVVYEMLAGVMRLRSNILPQVDDKNYTKKTAHIVEAKISSVAPFFALAHSKCYIINI